ncbi:MAG: methyltransferase domain-containing protein [Planctomycetaceae bacterium]|nr:methyltransferase domain-containing protein [Planctomycetaceae bacterium]
MTRLVCPSDQSALSAAGESLTCPSCGRSYPVREGIARFVSAIADDSQKQVEAGFAYKWTRDEWGFEPKHIELMQEFFWTRFGFSSHADVAALFGGKTVLHAGIGSGQCEQHYLQHCREVWGLDISQSVDAAQRNWHKHYPDLAGRLHLVQADLMSMPFDDGAFDIVFSDGVLHHTPDTRAALGAITAKVRPGGLVVFYVYKKKAPIREFVDTYLRDRISDLPPEQAWQAMEPLTALARDLSRQKLQIAVPQDIPLLELQAGTFDLQRWLYWNVMKLYWNELLDFDGNNHVNYDWYYPKYAWRHTAQEVQNWLDELRLETLHLQAGDSGISVIARKG